MIDNPSQLAFEIPPAEAHELLEAGEAVLIDVREPHEFALARLNGARLIPMNDIPVHFQELERAADERLLVVYCHHGIRSLDVVLWLRGQGIEQCVSLMGGIDLWSRQVDGSVPRY